MADTKGIGETPQQQAESYKNLHTKKREWLLPRLAAWAGAILLGLLYAALPAHVTVGPSWLPLVVEIVIMLITFSVYLIRRPIFPHTVLRVLNFILLGFVTLILVVGVSLMIYTLPNRSQTQGGQLLRTAALLWLSNIIVFALWYWEIDGGGPAKRRKSGHQAADFMFPQQVNGNTEGWAPYFLDYLFVSFTGATALSPTDTYPLTRIAKLLMMIEAIIALISVAIIAGRAVNIL